MNALAPLAATPMTETIRTNEKFAANMMARIPLKRWAEPEEVAGAFVFLASDAAGFITGQCFSVDGGFNSHTPIYGDALTAVSTRT